MTVPTRTAVLDALASVTDSSGRDIVSAGLLAGLTVEEGRVRFSIEAGDPEKAAALEPLRARAEQAARTVPGVVEVSAVLTAERTGVMPARPQRQGGRGDGAAAIKHVIAIASGKGGVGKSTTAVNLALALAGLGLRIGILDVDVYGPSLPRMLGIVGAPRSDGRMLEPMEKYGILAMSIGFMVAEREALIWRGPMVQSALLQMLNDVLWGPLDVLVLDMPPGTGDAPMTMVQNARMAGAVIVSTPQDIALLDARRGLAMFRKMNVPVLGVIENMNLFVCPDCGHQSHIFGHGGARAEAEKQGTPFLGEIPLHLDIRVSGDAGYPVVAAAPDGAHAMAYRAIAARITAALNESG